MKPQIPWSKRTFEPEVGMERLAGAREAHYREFLGDGCNIWSASGHRLPQVNVFEFAPTELRPFWTYITSGMSDSEQSVPSSAPEWVTPRTELLLYTEEKAPWAAHLLHGFARYPFDFGTHFFWWHTVPVGGPVDGEDARLTSLVLLPPYFEHDGFDELIVEGSRLRLMWLVPITEAEREFAMVYGTHKLEQLFHNAQLDPVTQLQRPSVI